MSNGDKFYGTTIFPGDLVILEDDSMDGKCLRFVITNDISARYVTVMNFNTNHMYQIWYESHSIRDIERIIPVKCTSSNF